MESVSEENSWYGKLIDPTGLRDNKPRKKGKTMVIDKGMGVNSFRELLETSGEYIDMVKIGFGTAPLYPPSILAEKIRLAKQYQVSIFPGGTFLEAAILQKSVPAYFAMVKKLGFTGVEISDGTIDMERKFRNELILLAVEHSLTVYTEYGKKLAGSFIEADELAHTVYWDMEFGAEMVTIEGRESGMGVGIYDEKGKCRDRVIEQILEKVSNHADLMWEAPLKSQQVHLIKTLGPQIHIGNVSPLDILSLEALRRGLRSDTLPVIHRFQNVSF
jgi:phosphosulfolactate synthase